MIFISNLENKYTAIKWILLWISIKFITITNGQLCPANDGNPQTSDLNACYIYIKSPISWQEADSFCQTKYGGALAQTTSTAQLDKVKAFAASHTASAVWLGARQVLSGWKWSDGTDPAYTYWDSQSDYQYYQEMFNCANINLNKKYFWTKDMCSHAAEMVCEVATSSPHCVNIGVERISMTVNNRCFILIQNQYKSWFASQQYCKSLGGDIAKVDSQAIQDQIAQNLSPSLWRRFWIGLKQYSFYWSTGKEVSTYFWEDRQPSSGMCVVLRNDTRMSNTYKWHTENCNRQRPFICQTGSDTSSRVVITTQVIPTKPPTTTTTTKPTTTTLLTTTTPVRPEVVASQSAEDAPNTGLIAGMSVLIVIVFAILIGLLIFFWYYTRRNRLLKKAARADASRLDAENGGQPHPEFSNAGFKDGIPEENPEEAKTSMFTTSFTSTGRASKQKIYNVAAGTGEPKRENTSRSSSTTSLQATDTKQPSPVNNPETFDNGLYQNVASSKRSLKTDSEGTSENDDARYNDVRSSKRRELGERGSRIRRSGSKVSPEIKQDYGAGQNLNGSQNLDQSGPLPLLATTGSMRRGNALPPMDSNLEEQASQKTRNRRYKTKDQVNGENEDNVRSSKRKHHRRQRNDDVVDQQHSDEANNVQIELGGSMHGYTSDDTPRNIAKSHRGRGSQRRVRVNKKKQDNADHDSTSDHNSNPDSPKYPEQQKTKRDKHLKKHKKQAVDENNYEFIENSQTVYNGYKENGYDYDEPYEDIPEPKKVDHDKTLYLETCNTLDNTSDVEVDIESLPDDYDGKQDIFV